MAIIYTFAFFSTRKKQKQKKNCIVTFEHRILISLQQCVLFTFLYACLKVEENKFFSFLFDECWNMFSEMWKSLINSVKKKTVHFNETNEFSVRGEAEK